MDSAPASYQQLKHTDSAYALVQAASLPYEHFSERSGSVVPGTHPGPESQLTDAITTEVRVDSALRGYIEVNTELATPMAMTAANAMLSTSDDCFGPFVYQANGLSTVCTSGYLQSPTRKRSVMVNDYTIPFSVTTAIGLIGGVRFLRRSTLPHPVLYVNMEYTPGGGVWIPVGAPQLMDGLVISIPFTLPINTAGVRFPVSVQFNATTQVALDITVQPDSGSYRFPHVWSTLELFSWPYLSSLPATQMMRRIACDALFTWTGSTLENGGKIAGGLVPHTFVPNAENPFTAVATLRSDRMDGPIKFGAHGTWRAAAVAELDRVTVFDWQPARLKLVFGYSFASSEGSARIRQFGMFGFTSTNPIIGRMMWTPAATPAMIEALGIYWENYPALTSNEDHVILKSIKSAGRLGVRGLKALLEQDDKLAALALSMGQPEVATAIKMAGTVNRARKAKKARATAKKPNPAPTKKPRK